MAIIYNNADVNFKLFEKRSITKLIKYLFASEKKEVKNIDFIFCTDEYLLQINSTFLHHNYYTDIITFDLSEAENNIIAEIYISITRVTENASLLQVNFKVELLRVVLHGCLHLCGYKDKKKSEIILMRQKEDYYLQRYKKIKNET